MLEYSWSTDREGYHGQHETLDGAVVEAVIERDLKPGHVVWVGENIGYDAVSLVRSCIDADHVIERLNEHAYDNVGEFAEEWPDVSDIDRQKLDEALVNAIVPFLDAPKFWTVEKAVQVEVTMAMFLKAHPLDKGPAHCRRCFEPIDGGPEPCEEDGEPCEALTAEDFRIG